MGDLLFENKGFRQQPVKAYPFSSGVGGRIRDAIQSYKSGQFQASSQPNVAAHTGTGFGMGEGMGMGRRRGRGMGFASEPILNHHPASNQEEMDALKEQSQALAQRLWEIECRIQELREEEQ